MVKLIENYILSEVIGQGSYGTVYKAKHKINHNIFAIKIIPIEKFLQHQKLQEYIANEIQTLTTIGISPHVIRYFQKFKTKNNFYFVYEFCNGGNLFDMIKKQKQIPQDEALQIFRQLLQAFKVLNRYNIMHRDIKPQNILFNQNIVKLADFGFCKGMKPDQNLTKTMLGSPIYMAPQVLKGEPYTTKADIWSLGVIMYEMIFGTCPFQSDCIANLISTVDTKPLFFPTDTQVSQKTQTLIKRMLTKDYFRRMSWVELFGIKIDENGCYIDNKANLTQVSNIIDKRSTSQAYSYKKKNTQIQTQSFDAKYNPVFAKNISESVDRKPTSLTKEEKKKVFYSQNYMDIFSKPIEKSINDISSPLNSPSKEIDQETHAQTQQPKSITELSIFPKNSHVVSYKSFEYLRTENEKERRENLLKIHESCVQILRKTLKQLQNKNKELLADCYIILKKVHKKLKNITQQIKITETNLLDMASIVNYEIIQVDRMLIQIRNELLKQKIDIPQVQESRVSGNLSKELKSLVFENFIN